MDIIKMNLEAKMFMSNHKTVFVIDHTPYFGISCEDLMEFDLNKTRGLNVIPLAPISKSLWTCGIEAAIEYCRIVWDLFPEGKLIRFIASDSTAHHFNSWEQSQQSISHILNNSAYLGIPPRAHQQGDFSVIHGLRAAVEAITECSEIQHIKRTSLTESATKLINKCRIICITSTRDNASMKSLQEIFLKVLIQQNKVAAATDHLITVHHCHLVLINIYPNNGDSQVTAQPLNELSPLLTAEVHSVCAGKGLNNKLSHLILNHYGLASTTVTGIPMKEEQNASSSANYDVEIFHHANAHADLFKALVTDPLLIKTRKEGADYDTVTLKWCTPRGSSAHEMHNCTAAYRVTPVDVNSRPSSCLINFLLNGRSVMLEMPKRVGGKTISHLLTAHGGEIFIHALATGRSVLEDPPSISEGCGGRVTDYRITDFGVLMQNNLLIPLQGRQSENGDKIGLPINRMKNRLDRQTKYWPITISGTFIMNLRQYIDPLPQLLTKEELTPEEVIHCKQVITSLAALEMKHEPLIQPNTGIRGKGQKREEQYKLMWNELEKFVRTHCRSDQHNKVLHCLLECRNKEPESKSSSGEKVELDQALRELDVMTSKFSETYGNDLSVARASVIRATTDSPMSPPPVSKATSPLLMNSRQNRTTASLSIYSGPRTLMDLWTGKIAAENKCMREKRPDFYGRVNASGSVATLYPNIVKDERERNSRPEDMVKVWFQNRRTKHKRMQQEEEAKAQQHQAASAGSNKNSHHVTKWKAETQGGAQSTTASDGTQYIEYDEDEIASSGEEA